MVYLCPSPPPPHIFHLYYITLTNNYLAFFIYQLIILWTILINWHRWLLVNNNISKYNLFILVLYRRYINYVSVCPPPPPHFLAPIYIYIYKDYLRYSLSQANSGSTLPVTERSNIYTVIRDIWLFLNPRYWRYACVWDSITNICWSISHTKFFQNELHLRIWSLSLFLTLLCNFEEFSQQ